MSKIISLGLFFCVVTAADALTMNVVSGELQGVQGVVVNNQTYDVVFKDGKCANFYVGCTGLNRNFTFNNPGMAKLASQALVNQVFTEPSALDPGNIRGLV